MNEATTAWIMSGGYRTLPIYPGAKECYNTLTAKYDVSVVTARIGTFGHMTPEVIEQVRSDTLKWFEDHDLEPHNLTFEANKVAWCKTNGVGIMLEDKLPTALEGAKVGLYTVLVDRYWNQSPPRLRVYRAKNYNEVLDRLDSVTSR